MNIPEWTKTKSGHGHGRAGSYGDARRDGFGFGSECYGIGGKRTDAYYGGFGNGEGSGNGIGYGNGYDIGDGSGQRNKKDIV